MRAALIQFHAVAQGAASQRLSFGTIGKSGEIFAAPGNLFSGACRAREGERTWHLKSKSAHSEGCHGPPGQVTGLRQGRNTGGTVENWGPRLLQRADF
jgi:hypothetical protein